jgi:hypothetical protein
MDWYLRRSRQFEDGWMQHYCGLIACIKEYTHWQSIKLGHRLDSSVGRTPDERYRDLGSNPGLVYHIFNPRVTFGDRLIDYLLFYVPLKNISLIWRRHHFRWRAANLGLCSVLRAFEQGGIFIGVARDLGFIRRTAPFSRLLRHACTDKVWTCYIWWVIDNLWTGYIWWYV